MRNDNALGLLMLFVFLSMGAMVAEFWLVLVIQRYLGV